MEPRPAIVIYDDGGVEIVAQITVAAANIGIQRLQQALGNVRVGPQPMPPPTQIEEEESE